MSQIKTALITGITGQDGSYLAELLIDKGYKVHGLIRRSSLPNTLRINSLLESNKGLDLQVVNLSESDSIIYIADYIFTLVEIGIILFFDSISTPI